MRRIIVVAAVLGLASGLLGAFAYGQLVGQAGAAPPPPPETPVREQNLDGSGRIRVHEQGTADVNVTNASLPVTGTLDVGNLPSVQDVNVLTLPQAKGKLIELGTIETGGGEVEFPAADVSYCRQISLFAAADEAGSLALPLVMLGLPDGSTPVGILLPVDPNLQTSFQFAGTGGKATSSITNVPLAIPFLRLRIGQNTPSSPPWNVTAWLWCVP
ncbi:MAG: hypothetical protein HYS09_02545 [Chloroflexi bacterium]|nr:hypothetical protein [Chloroflexota bacterium]